MSNEHITVGSNYYEKVNTFNYLDSIDKSKLYL
jgi:hypothetical protein